jgi:oligosaccharide repeat unit polymerase
MAESSLPIVEAPTLPAASRPASASVSYSLAAIGLFGSSGVLLLFLAWFVPSSQLWSPAVSCALAYGLFGAHVLLVRRHLVAFDPGIWIAVNMLLNYFGMVIGADLLDSPERYDHFNLGTPPRLNQSFVVALLTLVAFLFGLHLAGWMRRVDRPVPWPVGTRLGRGAAWCTTVIGGAMLLVGIPIAGADLLFGSYGEMKMAQKDATADLRFFGTGVIILQCGIYALVAHHERGRPAALRAAIAASIPFSILRVAVGDRTGLMTLALGAGWAFGERVRKIPVWITVTGFVGAFLVMPIIGEYREFKAVEGLEGMQVKDLAASSFMNMGSSLVAFSYTLDNIPSRKKYDWGGSIVAQLIESVPNLGFSPGRAFGLDRLKHNPSKWLVSTANPSKWKNAGGGYGYAVGAEWYFNLGMPGVFFGMALMGWLTGKARNASRSSPMGLLMASMVFVMMVSSVRNDFGYPFRQFAWPMAVFATFYYLLPKRVVRGDPASNGAQATGSR